MRAFAGFQDWGSDSQTWIYKSKSENEYYLINLYDGKYPNNYSVAVSYLNIDDVTLDEMSQVLTCYDRENVEPSEMIEMLFGYCQSKTLFEISSNNYKKLLVDARNYVRNAKKV